MAARSQGKIEETRAREDELLGAYRAAVHRAFSDVENALGNACPSVGSGTGLRRQVDEAENVLGAAGSANTWRAMRIFSPSPMRKNHCTGAKTSSWISTGLTWQGSSRCSRLWAEAGKHRLNLNRSLSEARRTRYAVISTR